MKHHNFLAIIFLVLLLIATGCEKKDIGLTQIESEDYIIESDTVKPMPQENVIGPTDIVISEVNEDDTQTGENSEEMETEEEGQLLKEDLVPQKKYTLYENDVMEFNYNNQVIPISIESSKTYGTIFNIDGENTKYLKQNEELEIQKKLWLKVGPRMRGDRVFVEIQFFEYDYDNFPDIMVEESLGEAEFKYSEQDTEEEYDGEDTEDFIMYSSQYTNAEVILSEFSSEQLAAENFQRKRKAPYKLKEFVTGDLLYYDKESDSFVSWVSGKFIVEIDLSSEGSLEDIIMLMAKYLEKYPSSLTQDYMRTDCYDIVEGQKKLITHNGKDFEIQCFVISDASQEVGLLINGKRYSHIDLESFVMTEEDFVSVYVNRIDFDVQDDRDSVNICMG